MESVIYSIYAHWKFILCEKSFTVLGRWPWLYFLGTYPFSLDSYEQRAVRFSNCYPHSFASSAVADIMIVPEFLPHVSFFLCHRSEPHLHFYVGFRRHECLQRRQWNPDGRLNSVSYLPFLYAEFSFIRVKTNILRNAAFRYRTDLGMGTTTKSFELLVLIQNTRYR